MTRLNSHLAMPVPMPMRQEEILAQIEEPFDYYFFMGAVLLIWAVVKYLPMVVQA